MMSSLPKLNGYNSNVTEEPAKKDKVEKKRRNDEL